MRLCRLLALTALLSLVQAAAAHADGLIPRHPYRYLHPPPALARTNKKPLSGERLVRVVKGRNTDEITHFTRDGQAGIGVHSGTLAVGSGVKQIDLSIRPVNLPAPLPHGYQLDGNAYEVSATGRPGKTPAKLLKRVGMIFRWALLPHAMLVYSAKRWRLVCDVTSKDWQIDSLVVACQSPILGTFVLARRIYR